LQARGELEALTSEEKIALEVQMTGELTQRPIKKLHLSWKKNYIKKGVI
jgi:hypothetical protein